MIHHDDDTVLQNIGEWPTMLLEVTRTGQEGGALPTTGPHAAAAHVQHGVEFARQKNSLQQSGYTYVTDGAISTGT